MSQVTHLRKPDWTGTYCNTKAKGQIRTTGTPTAAECTRCRKAAGLGKYNALEALAGIVKVQGAVA
jgi:hypothetical protein